MSQGVSSWTAGGIVINIPPADEGQTQAGRASIIYQNVFGNSGRNFTIINGSPTVIDWNSLNAINNGLSGNLFGGNPVIETLSIVINTPSGASTNPSPISQVGSGTGNATYTFNSSNGVQTQIAVVISPSGGGL